jgi:chemotaxis protein methyltransferase CheR
VACLLQVVAETDPRSLHSIISSRKRAMTTLAFTSYELSDEQFAKIKQLLYRVCGIDLKAGKEGLVRSRLSKRLRTLGIGSFEAYLEYVEGDEAQQELYALVDAMTTNKTSFFREKQHFDFLAQELLPQWESRSTLRLWSAACSSGEEPLTLAMVLREAMGDMGSRDVRVLATDISDNMLKVARAGVYDDERLADVPPELRRKYFTCVEASSSRRYEAKASLKDLLHYARLNLMDAWPVRGPFDVIFCRNVMIYFDKKTQADLIGRFCDLLRPGGHLFVGHAESLTGISHSLRYVQPALYMR